MTLSRFFLNTVTEFSLIYWKHSNLIIEHCLRFYVIKLLVAIKIYKLKEKMKIIIVTKYNVWCS